MQWSHTMPSVHYVEAICCRASVGIIGTQRLSGGGKRKAHN